MISKKPIIVSRGSNFKWIELADFEPLCFRLAKELMPQDQPIPDFITRSPGILESCLETPLQKFGGKDLYPTFGDKVAALFYFLIKNHPFQNGNKRIAVTTLLAILYLNKCWLKISAVQLYNLAREVAESDREDKEKTMKAIFEAINKYLIDI